MRHTNLGGDSRFSQALVRESPATTQDISVFLGTKSGVSSYRFLFLLSCLLAIVDVFRGSIVYSVNSLSLIQMSETRACQENGACHYY